MCLGFGIALFNELLFFLLVVEDTIDRIEVVTFPVCLSSFSLHNFIVCFDFNVIVHNVFVCHYVVLPWVVLLLVFILFDLSQC